VRYTIYIWCGEKHQQETVRCERIRLPRTPDIVKRRETRLMTLQYSKYRKNGDEGHLEGMFGVGGNPKHRTEREFFIDNLLVRIHFINQPTAPGHLREGDLNHVKVARWPALHARYTLSVYIPTTAFKGYIQNPTTAF